MAELYIGAMSGTSLDGVDTVLILIDKDKIDIQCNYSEAFPSNLREQILSLCSPGKNEIQRLGELNVILANFTAKAINKLLLKARKSQDKIKAIGSHGQTVRHIPNTLYPFSLQIGDPSLIAHLTGITTVADFRMADIAAGGQGAPLVPAFHQAVFSSKDTTRAIINIGGIANITFLPPTNNSKHTRIKGYDIGPGNTLMDQWIQQKLGKPYDDKGIWADSGKLQPELLSAFMEDEFIQKSSPKSSGREYFNLAWIQKYLEDKNQGNDEDIQRTLNEFTASCIAKSIKFETQNIPCEVYLCGGGVNNNLLTKRLSKLLPYYPIATTTKLGIDPQLVEAAAFAWLASQTIKGLAGNITAVTGASCAKILGGIYPA